jgi:hypothetical protein
MKGLPPRQSAADGDVLSLDSGSLSGLSWVTPSGGGGGGGAPTSASYLVLGVNATLTAERVLTAGTGIALTDAGAGSTLTVAVDLDDYGSTNGDLLVRSGGTWTALAAGTSGRVLTAAGAGVVPSWTTLTAASVGADPTGTAAAEVAAHEADADPHPQYLQSVDVPTWLVLGADTANSTTTPVDVADLTFTPAGSTTYLLEIWLPFRTAASTTGLRWQVYDATGGTESYQTISAPASATTQVLRLSHCLAGNAALGTGTGAGGTPGLAYGWALIVTPASPAGNISIRFYSEVAGSAITLKAGACVRLTVVP